MAMTHPSHGVQGFNNDQMPADWPAISASEVAWLRSRFPQLGGAGEVLWHSPRPLSASAIIEGARGRFFIKRHHRSVRSAPTLAEEHRFIAHLASAGMPVVHVQHDEIGASAIEHGDWTYELHAVDGGLDLYRDSVSWTPMRSAEQARAAGRMLARLHDASEAYVSPQRSTHILVARDDLIRSPDPVATLQQQLGERPALADYLSHQAWPHDLQQHVLPWHAGVSERLQHEPRLWAHNDWHASNLLWTNDGADADVARVFDFGLSSPSSALFDLATAIERNAIAWLQLPMHTDIAHADIALALLDGYREVRPLNAAQLRLLADLLPVVHVDFALSEVEYFHGITGSQANADLAYHDFLLGHARWFASAAGRALLATLRDKA